MSLDVLEFAIHQNTFPRALLGVHNQCNSQANADEVGGFMYRRIALAIFAFSIGFYSHAQDNPGRGWTDKNNAEEYAAYLIRIAYYDLGYLGARVQVRENGTRRIFEVEPGRVYRIKDVQILGNNDLPAQAITAAPTVGDVYSNARINDWVDTLRRRYKKDASWGMRADHANASVMIEVGLDADSIPHPK